MLPATILYAFGVFTDEFYSQYGALSTPPRGKSALTGCGSVFLGAVRLSCPSDLDALWRVHPLEYYGYIFSTVKILDETLERNVTWLDKWTGFLEPAPNVTAGEMIRAIEDDDQSWMAILQVRPDVAVDMTIWTAAS